MKILNTKFNAIFLLTFNVSAQNPCHPLPNFWKNQFIIGYGSLMNEASKQETSVTVGQNEAIFLKNYQREWNVALHDRTYLGVKAHPKHQFSAVFFKLPLNQIELFDKREQNYCRVAVSTKDIISIPATKKLPQGQFWLYLPQKPTQGDRSTIPDYYLRLYLHGCKKIAKELKLSIYYQSCLRDLPKKGK